VYIESSVVSYRASRPSRDLIIAARQEVTRQTWPRLLEECDAFISATVLQEISLGDPDAARARLEAVQNLPVLSVDGTVEVLSQALIDAGAIPGEHPEDAVHVAVAAMNGMDYLVTWNFAHINNASARFRIREVIEGRGFVCPEICSPEELFGDDR
jgi:predicted nucleic acid-binding protein